MVAETLGLITTFKCPIRCGHCLFECGPSRKEEMKYDDMRKIIGQAYDCRFRQIAFTGGEPFLDFRKLERGIYLADKYHMDSSAATSCYWASDYCRAIDLLGRLRGAGLNRLSISTDDFHLAYVPFRFVKNAIQAASYLDLKVEIQCVVTAKTVINRSYLIEQLKSEKAENPTRTKISIMETNVLPLGRALRSIKREELSTSCEQRLAQPCPFVIRSPAVTPDGLVSACCGFGATNRNGFDSMFLAGNLQEEGLNKIIERIENDLLFNYLSIDGPYSLMKLLQKEFNFAGSARYGSICDVCHSLTDERVREALGKVLPKTKTSILLKKKALKAKQKGRCEDCKILPH